MTDVARCTRLRALRCGHLADALLADGRRGRVAALFRSSLYLADGDRIACVGNEALHACSVNVSTDAGPELDWRASGLAAGTGWRVLGRTLHLGGQRSIAIEGAQTWFPCALPGASQAPDLGRGVQALRRLCERRAPDEGLGRVHVDIARGVAGPGPRRIAAPAVVALGDWLTDEMTRAGSGAAEGPRDLHMLVGLGPGLTPSGDDLLCGVLFTARALGRADVAARLWRRVRRLALAAGNAISLGHLAAAAAGGGSAPVDDLLGALVGGASEDVDRMADTVDAVGHTSGWDCVAGVLVATQAALRRRTGSEAG